MNLGELGCNATTERVSEVGGATAIDGVCNAHVIIRRAGIEFRSRVGWPTVKRHIAAILSEKNGTASTSFNLPCPVDLPESQIRVTVKADQNTRRMMWITDQVT